MKKIVLFSLLTILLTACTTESEVFTWKYRIYAEDMEKRVDAAGTYYEYSVDEPKLTNEVFDRGVLQAFMYYTKDEKDTMCPLPFSDFILGRDYQYEEHFTVEFQPRKIKFIQKISDHADQLPTAKYYDILVRFLW